MPQLNSKGEPVYFSRNTNSYLLNNAMIILQKKNN